MKIRDIKYKKNKDNYLYERIIKKKDMIPEQVNFLNDIVGRM